MTPTAEILTRIMEWLRRYLVLSHAQMTVIALWVLHTWAVDAADYTPYLHVTAPEKGCGKTRLLEVLEPIVCRPWMTSRVSAAVLTRKLDKEKSTLLLDESDAAFKGDTPYTEALRGILNSGFKRGGVCSLCVGAEMSPKDFHCFGPKAIAGIGNLPDTVASRSVVIAMRRKTADEKVERFRLRLVKPAAEEIQAIAAAWATQETIETLRWANPQISDEMTDRQGDISEPLLAIADFADGVWPREARAALLQLYSATVSEDGSTGVQLLQDIRTVFNEQGSNMLPSFRLADALCQMEGQPWSEFMHGKGMSPSILARKLKPHGIAPRTIRLDAARTLKGYTRESFTDAWDRYCRPTSEIPVTAVTSVTTRINTGDLQCEVTSQSGFLTPQSRHNGVFHEPENAASHLPSSRNISSSDDTESPRQSSFVTDVTPVTAAQGTGAPATANLPAWEEIGRI